MAKRKEADLISMLRARGLRKRVATTVADALGGGRRASKAPPKAVARVLGDLRGLADEIEERATGRGAKRKAAAKKAADTRKRKARARSAAAKKGAKTRAKGRGR